MFIRPAVMAFLFVFTLQSIARCQQNFLPGQVILASGVKMNGRIDYRNWEKNPRSLSFISSAGEKTQVFGVSDLKQFEIFGKDQYEYAIVKKDMRSVNYNSPDPDGSSDSLANVYDTVWLRQVFSGNKVRLYELVDSKTHFYIRRGADEITELQYRIIINTDRSNFSEIPAYRDQITGMFPTETAGLHKLIGQSRYTRKDLTKILASFDGTPQDASSADSERDVRLFLGPKLSYNNISFPINYRGLDAVKTREHLGYGIAGGIDLPISRNFQRVFAQVALGYSSYKYKGDGRRSEGFNVQQKYYAYELQINSITSRIAVGHRLGRPTGLNPFLALALGVNFSSYPTNRIDEKNLTAGTGQTTEKPLSFEKSWMEASGIIGVTIMHFEVSGSTNILGNFGNFSQWKPDRRVIELQIAYLFGK